jgi:hypothetical protein
LEIFIQRWGEVGDISIVEAPLRLLSLAAVHSKHISSFCDKTASTPIAVIVDTALQWVGLSKNNLRLKPEGCVSEIKTADG